jgi:hypothetical protein
VTAVDTSVPVTSPAKVSVWRVEPSDVSMPRAIIMGAAAVALIVGVGAIAIPSRPDPAAVAGATGFGNGTYRVDTDIQQGMYQTSGPVDPSKPCHIEWLKGMSGTAADVLDSSDLKGPTQLPIQHPEVAFKSVGCGTWTKVR